VLAISLCVIAVCLLLLVVKTISTREESGRKAFVDAATKEDAALRKSLPVRQPAIEKPNRTVGNSPTNASPAQALIHLKQT
jgi:hypothetical protein